MPETSSAVNAISTHALTWSATMINFLLVLAISISTHALTWSATTGSTRKNRRTEKFQLTHSRGVRLSIPNFDKAIFNFNSRTHVECDNYRNGEKPENKKFQLTHSRGVRRRNTGSAAANILFQLTHSRGVRPNRPKFGQLESHFNSRTHVECDLHAAGEM